MALLISRRLFRPLNAFFRCYTSSLSASKALQVPGDDVPYVESSTFTKGTHSTKTISEVSGTGRKPWRHKGTGRARHGTLRGPQFRGGATMHGPKPRTHAIKLNKKVQRLGLKCALTARTAEGKLMVFEDLELPAHKTKNVVNYVRQIENTKKLLLVDGGPISEKLKLATQKSALCQCVAFNRSECLQYLAT